MAAAARYQIGDVVWSKMKGYCPWPSRIAEQTESSLKPPNNVKGSKPMHLVYFFGSNNYAWLSEDSIKPYDEYKDKNKNGSKSVQFKDGLKQIEEYTKNGGYNAQLEASQKDSAINKEATVTSATTKDSQNDANKIFEDLPSIDEELAMINNKKTTIGSPPRKSYNILNDSPTKPTRDTGRSTKARKATKSDDVESSSPTKRTKTSEDSLTAASLGSKTSPLSSLSTTSGPTAIKPGVRNVIMRAQISDNPLIDTPQVNMNTVTEKSKQITPSSLKFGFVGLGMMGQRLVKNLLNSGHHVTIWNRTPTKCKEFIEAGAFKADTPADVVIESDITFSCLSDPKASKEIVFGSFGILAEMDSSKCFVEMSSIDPETSNDISEAILNKGGRYLEAPMIGSGKEVAEAGELTIVAAGDRSLYEKCSSCFQAMAKKTFFLGHQVGTATKMNLIFSMLYGMMIGSLVECCTLAERSQLELYQFREILQLSPMNCPLLDSRTEQIFANNFERRMPLNHLQKDLRLALTLSEEYEQPLPITAATNEVYKMAKRYGYGEQDAAAVYLRSRF